MRNEKINKHKKVWKINCPCGYVEYFELKTEYETEKNKGTCNWCGQKIEGGK